MRLNLRGLGMAALACAALGAATAHAQQAYPVRPIRIVAPFAAGTGPDANAREIAAELSKILGQNAYIDNRPGASGIIGTEAAARSAPDGYTLYIGTTSTMSVVPHLYSKLPFDVSKDFAPVSLLGILQTGLTATPGLPANDVPGLLALVKARPDAVNVASLGPGSYSHLSGVWFGFSANAALNLVPYNNNSPVADLLAGQVQLMFDGLPAMAGNIRAGKLKLLAITGQQRHPAFPGTPTFAEAGLGDFEPIAWQGLFAPAGTPAPILDKLSAAMRQAAQSPELQEKWRSYGGELKGNTPAEFAAFLTGDRAKWGAVIKRAGVKLD